MYTAPMVRWVRPFWSSRSCSGGSKRDVRWVWRARGDGWRVAVVVVVVVVVALLPLPLGGGSALQWMKAAGAALVGGGEVAAVVALEAVGV